MAFYEHRVGAICSDPKLMLMPWDDHLVHRGDGVFETLKYLHRRIYQLDAHLERMKKSAAAIFLSPPCDWERVREIILDVARAASADLGLLRILLGRGPGGFGIDMAECPVPSLYIVAYDFHPKPESVFETGVTALRTTVPAKQPFMAKIKSTDYLPNALMKKEATEKGADFPVCFCENGFLAEGATENICIVDAEGKFVIPELNNALTGTTLMRALDLIKGEIPVAFRGIREEELYQAKEIIILGTTMDALSIVRYNGKPVHDVRPGPVSKKLRAILQQDLLDNGVLF
jgi:branched-chain amino acid aminotransferase